MENYCEDEKYCEGNTIPLRDEVLLQGKRRSFLEKKAASDVLQAVYFDENTYQKLIKKLEEYYAVYDIENGTSHKEIFHLLYLSNKNYRYEKIAQLFFLDVRTLKRYVAKYKELARRLLICEII